MTEFSRTDAEHGQEQFYPSEFPAALHGSPRLATGQATVGSLSAAEKDTDKVIIITFEVTKSLSSVRSTFFLLLLSRFRFVSYSTIPSYLIREPRINDLEGREHSAQHSIRYY